MKRSFIKKLLIISMLFFLNVVYATTVDVEAYIKTSGTQPVNTTTQKVNDNIICPEGNDNLNSHPGCDMSHDTKFNNQGNDDPSDDVYEPGNDMIVRTGDSFLLEVTVNANDGDLSDFTITSTLPSDKGIEWDRFLPKVCKSGSDVSEDGLTMTCIRDSLDSGTVEKIDFAVNVLQSAKNGTELPAFSFSVSSSDLDSEVTVDTDTQITTDDDRLTITAAPRWNIDIDRSIIENDYNNSGTMGYLIHFPFALEMDHVDGAVDDIDSYVGSEQLGDDFALNINAEITSTSPSNNAQNIECVGQYTDYALYPYGYYKEDAPKMSVATPLGEASINCAQSDNKVAITYEHIDASMNHIPTQTRTGNSLPTFRKFAEIGELKIFVPYDDIKAAGEKTDEDGDTYYEANITVSLKDFDPNSISGTSNFNDDIESLKDNNETVYLVYYPNGKGSGSFSKTFHSVDGGMLRNTQHLNDGLGRVVAGGEFSFRLNWANTGTKDFNDSKICDVIDANTFEITKYEGSDSPLKFMEGENLLKPQDVSVKYGVGYEGTWPPPLDKNNSDAILAECTGTKNTTWYDSYDEAVKNGPITKIMVTTNKLAQGKILLVDVHTNAKARDLNGNLNPVDTMLPNYTALYDDVLYAKDDDHWVASEKILDPNKKGCDEPNDWNDASADRACLDLAHASVEQTLSTQRVEYQDEINVSIHPAFTLDANESVEDNVTVVAVLPKGFTYKVGSASVEPKIGECEDIEYDWRDRCLANPDDYQVLVWDFGIIKANVPLPDLNYTTVVDARADEGYNYILSEIHAPNTDHSTISYRKDKDSVVVAVPKRFHITKRVLTPFRDINQAPITFVTDTKNAFDDSLSNIDIIDILPFNGDGTDGFDFGTDDHHLREEPTNYHGTLYFESVEGLEKCNNGISWEYSNTPPTQINLSPKHDSNLPGGSTNWCIGDENGPDENACGFGKEEVTAVRLKYSGTLENSEMCSLKLNLTPYGNQYGDIYTNNSGASAEELSLAVMSNDVSAIVPTTGVGDFVWLDANQNGIQDEGERGVANIELKLLDASNGDSEVATTTSDENGYYSFNGLAPGDYRVQIVLPTDSIYTLTKKDQGNDDSKDSDADSSSDYKTDIKSVQSNEFYRDFDFGLIAKIQISGNIYDDGNGDGNVNGTPISAPDGEQLYVTLLDSSNTIVASKEVNSTGEYIFSDVDGLAPDSNYTIILSTEANATTPSLPQDWSNTGEVVDNNGTGNDGNADGKVEVELKDKNIPNIDFGINKRPTAIDKNATTQANPGGDTKVPTPTLEGNDTETPDKLEYQITSLPNNAKLYCEDNLITQADLNKTCAPNALSVDPDDGEQTVVFNYITIDPEGAKSDEATVTMPFTYILIAGNVFDDGNGDGNINGVPISKADDTQLYVTLLDNKNQKLASKALDNNGSYLFSNSDGVEANKEYKVILTTSLNSTTPSLPQNWNNADGEKSENNKTNGNDGKADGVLEVKVQNEALFNNDFGINKKPTAKDKSEPIQKNPGGKKQVVVPPLEVSDKEDGIPSIITIKTLPKEGTLYYDGKVVKEGEVIKDYNSSKLTLDPKDGNVTAVFKYTTTDRAGVESDEATVTMPFDVLFINGHLFNDTKDNQNVDGELITFKPSNTQLFFNLVDENGKILSSKLVDSNGSYRFDTYDGIEVNKTFKVVLSTTVSATPSLPSDWENKDGEKSQNSKTNGNDGKPDGVLEVEVKQSDVLNNDFGIRHIQTCLGDFVWLDKNSNGIQDKNEPPLANVRVTLLDKENNSSLVNAFGESIVSLVTDENGSYEFCDLIPNEYKVEFKAPNGYVSTLQNQGDESKDSDIPPYLSGGGVSDSVTLKAGDINKDLDAGFIQEISLGDFVWEDKNANGIQDENEEPLVGVGVSLQMRDENGNWVEALDVNNNIISKIETNSSGGYKFTHLKPGKDYKIIFDEPKPKDGLKYYVSPKNAGDDNKDSDIDENREIIIQKVVESNMSLDAGFFRAGCIGDFIWDDKNVNGIQDENESGLKGVKVELLLDGNRSDIRDINGEKINPILTKEDGEYKFCNLIPGNYSIKITEPDVNESDPNRWYITKANVGDDDIKDSDIDPTTKKSPIIKVESGDKNETIDGGLFKSVCVGGVIWEDINANGVKEPNEPAIADAKVMLTDLEGNYILDADGNKVEVFITQEDGKYLFCRIIPGKYKIKVELPPDYVTTTKDATNDNNDSDINNGGESDIIDTTSGEEIVINDGGAYKPGCIGDFVFKDTNANGIQDENDTPIEGAIVMLLDENGNKVVDISGNEVVEQVTSSDGKYAFCDLKPGTYKVRFQKNSDENGPFITTKKDATSDELDSDIPAGLVGGGESDLITLQSGEINENIDAGFVQEICIGDRVWYDENLNGIQDENLADYSVVDVKVHLYDANNELVEDVYGNVVEAVKTDKNGKYVFCHLQPGKDYKIKFEIPETYNATLANKTSDDKDSDANEEGVIEIKANELTSNLVPFTYNGIESVINPNYDLGIYCDCEDFKVHPEKYKDVKAPALNAIGAILTFIVLLLITFRKKEKRTKRGF